MTKRKKEDSPVKRNFQIDWESVMLDDGDDSGGKEDEVPELEIVSTKTTPPTPQPTFFSDEQMECQKTLTDQALNEQLERNKAHLLNFGPGLPDKGGKIRFKIASLEAEKQQRALLRSKMDVDRCSNLKLSASSSSSDVFTQGNTSVEEVSRSTFSTFFSKPKTDNESTKAFGKELEDLGCYNGKHKADKKTVTRPRVGKAEQSEKQFYGGSKGSKGNQKSKEAYAKKKPKESSRYTLLDDDNDDDCNGHETSRECSWKESTSQSSRRDKKLDDSVINVDEEEPQLSGVAEQVVELPEGLQEEICYPTRDDPGFVQVCLKDLECLAPREFLTSPVMNFYIRFLQQQVSSSTQVSADCHFFNTYFYKKLTDAVTYKGNDKDAFFVKFRRWWKGVDLFRKAYIFIPIHEDLHWSLVIVCIPDKEEESGLTILHLDSLRLHSKRSIVENVKRFLKDEWKYMNEDDHSLDIPISEKIWRNLPRRISEADIQVPQQKNDFDCGPFVLFFIERFIKEAPQRLKREDLGMFDKKWFRPDEASALRIKIRNTLIDLFRVNSETDRVSDQNDETCMEHKTIEDSAPSYS